MVTPRGRRKYKMPSRPSRLREPTAVPLQLNIIPQRSRSMPNVISPANTDRSDYSQQRAIRVISHEFPPNSANKSTQYGSNKTGYKRAIKKPLTKSVSYPIPRLNPQTPPHLSLAAPRYNLIGDSTAGAPDKKLSGTAREEIKPVSFVLL